MAGGKYFFLFAVSFSVADISVRSPNPTREGAADGG
jgi:hypothetical protein